MTDEEKAAIRRNLDEIAEWFVPDLGDVVRGTIRVSTHPIPPLPPPPTHRFDATIEVPQGDGAPTRDVALVLLRQLFAMFFPHITREVDLPDGVRVTVHEYAL